MRAKHISRVRRILTFLALLCVLQLLLNQAAGQITRMVFARGTGCSVSLSSPKVWLPTASATIEKVAIVCPGETEGFRAERLEIGISVFSLLRKLVLIDYLRIDGAQVRSINDDSAFFKTLEFIFKKEKKSPGAHWHSFLTSGWRAWAPRVEIFSIHDGEPRLLVGTDSFQVSGANIAFLAEDPTGKPEDPVQMTATAEDVQVSSDFLEVRHLGNLAGKATLGSKILKVLNARLKRGVSAGTSGNSVHTISGTVRFTDENEGYDLRATGSISDSLINELLLVELSEGSLNRGGFNYTASMSGEILAPAVQGSATLSVEDGRLFVPRAECMPEKMATDFSVSSNGLDLRNVVLDGVVREGDLSLSFDDRKTFTSNFSVTISDESTFAKRCFPVLTSSLGADDSLLPGGALTESATKVVSRGTLNPLDVKASVLSDVQASDVVNRSRLTSEIHYRKGTLDFTLEEKLHLARIEPRQGLIRKEQSSKPMTPFRAEKEALLSVDLTYDVTSNKILFDRLQIQHYPSVHLLRRVAPLLDKELFEQGRKTFRAKSLLGADGKGTFELSNGKGRGSFKFEVSSVSLFGLPTEKIVSRVLLTDAGVSVRDTTLFTRKGSASGEADLEAGGRLQGRLRFDQLDLSQFMNARSGDSIAPIDGELILSGTLAEPKLDGEVIARTQGRTVTTLAMSSITVSASRDLLRLDGTLFSNAAQFSLSYPFSGPKSDRFNVSIVANSLSIEEVLNTYNARRSEPSNSLPGIPASKSGTSGKGSVVSGSFDYSGDPRSLLRGSGTLRLTDLDLGGAVLKVVNADEIVAKLEDGRLVFNQVALTVGTERIDLKGYLDVDSGWNARIKGKVPLARTVLSLPVIEYVTGDVDVDVSIRGAYDDPNFKGTIDLVNGGVSIPVGTTVLGASDVSTKILFNGTAISIPSLTAKVGGGLLVGSALFQNPFDDLERSFEANMNLDRITFEPVDNFSARVSGEARVRAAPLGVPKLWARLRVLDALYEDEIDLTQILKTMTRRILGREDARVSGSDAGGRNSSQSSQAVDLDLELEAGDGLIIDTNIAEAELGASLAIKGTTKRPRVEGRIYTIDGVFGFEGTRFDIINGDLYFREAAEIPDPQVNIVGETTASTLEYGEQKIQIIVQGSLTEPEVTFSSDAGLSREEIVRLLSSGAGVRGFELFGGKKKDYTFRELVSLRSDVSLVDRLRGLTGVTTVEITTGLSSSTGEFVPTVVAKRPVTDEIAVQIESELAGEKTSKLSVEYPLTPYLSLVGGWTDNPPDFDGSESSDSFSIGFHFRRAFPPLLSPFRTMIKKRED